MKRLIGLFVVMALSVMSVTALAAEKTAAQEPAVANVKSEVTSLMAPSESGSCETVKAWIDQNKGSLPKTLAGIRELQLSKKYERGIFGELSPREKSELWKEKLTETLNEMRLNSQQRLVLDKGVTLMVPELYDESVYSEDREILKSQVEIWEAEMREFFSGQQVRAITRSIHPANQELLEDVGLINTGFSDPPPNTDDSCRCSTGHNGLYSNDCNMFTQVCDNLGGNWCDSTSFGCGAVWLQSCDGDCFRRAVRKIIRN